MASHKMITEDGKNWLKLVLDPFHDSRVDLHGYPDQSTVQSIVRLNKQKISVSAPGGSAWDCLIMVRPFFTAGSCTFAPMTATGPYESHYQYDHASIPSAFNLNDITIWTQNAGGTWNNAAAIAAMTVVGGLSMVPNDDVARFIAGGLEIIDTSPTIYQAGDVMVGSFPFKIGSGNLRLEDTNVAPETPNSSSAIHINSWPDTTAGFQAIPGTLNWEARRGVYMPLRLTELNIPFEAVGVKSYVTTKIPKGALGAVNYVSVPDAINVLTYGREAHAGIMDQYFILLTGLNGSATFDLVTRMFNEVPMHFGDQAGTGVHGYPDSINPFVTPASVYDPHALELYGRLAPKIPVAVPRDMNPAGEFFGNILKTLGSVLQAGSGLLPLATPLIAASPLAPAAPFIPPAAALGVGVGTGAKAVGNLLVQRSKKKRQNQPQKRK